MTVGNCKHTGVDVSGVDPRLPVGGSTNPPGEHQHTILPNFPKKLHGIEKILGRQGTLDLPLDVVYYFIILRLNYVQNF